MTESIQKGSAGKALAVLRVVLNNGPITSSQIARLLNESRTSVHRAVHVLIDNGFVRYQFGSKRVVVSGELCQKFVDLDFSPMGVDSIANAINETVKCNNVHLEVGSITSHASGVLVESTLAAGTYIEPFFESDIACMILSQQDPVSSTRLVSHALKRANLERPSIHFLDRLEEARREKKLWDKASQSMTLCVQVETAESHALRILAQGDDRLPWRKRCSDALNFFLAEISKNAADQNYVA